MSRQKIEQLRALARSTTFPAERDSANAKADALEAKLKAEQPPEPNPYTYTWSRTRDGRQEPWEPPQPKPERKPRRPWQGSMGEHDDLYRETLARIQTELERDRPSLSPRVRDILARRMANAEMIDRFGVD